MGWLVAEKGASLACLGPTEINEEAAKSVALAQSEANPGFVFQVRYHVNANAPAEVRWEALNGQIIEGTHGERVTPSEHRIGVRHFACFPAHIEQPDGGKRTAMIHDLSDAFKSAGASFKLYSPYPFPNRGDRKLDAFAQAASAAIPMHRQGTPRECAELVLFLASDDASFISGAEIAIDGGYIAAGLATMRNQIRAEYKKSNEKPRRP